MKFLRYMAFAVLVLIIVLLGFAVKTARETARQSQCQGHMNQLQLALRNYESTNGHFPPAFIMGPDGTPWHSWRVLILPTLGEEAVYEQYRFDEPWNGPNNSKLADMINLGWFQCPSRPAKQSMHTNYVAVVGEETAFPGVRSTTSDEIMDGPGNTILLAEIRDSGIHWMEPRDLKFESLTLQTDPGRASSTCISSHHPAGPAVVFADKITAYRLRPSLSLSKLRAMLTIAGGEEVTKESLKRWDPSNGFYLSESDD